MAKESKSLKGRFMRAGLIAACCVASTAIIAQTTGYIKRGGVELKSTAVRTSPTVATLKQGEKVTILAKDAAQVKVQTSAGKTGFVSSLNVSNTAVAAPGGKQVALSDNTAPSAQSNVRSMRGLEPLSKEYAVEKQLPEKAVKDAEQMEQTAKDITDSELESFATSGGVIPQ